MASPALTKSPLLTRQIRRASADRDTRSETEMAAVDRGEATRSRPTRELMASAITQPPSPSPEWNTGNRAQCALYAPPARRRNPNCTAAAGV
eukprot:CAMPEP_0182575106 /NCGR_PEP_ID=MMETSP1324-20130603/28860_1 /TAXON_ID=236786 /ORGANISM="Florenciella sp., Strain RCC1587" /LENGTH=91 /DNA_ID=CAMNT_0024790623 /DNA_START=16 /DNA_END=289 /DNA_ORIENTATION=-